MDRVLIEKKIDEVIEKLEETIPGTKEFTELSVQLRNLQDSLSKDIAQEETRAARENDAKLKEKELEVRLKGERSRSIWTAIGAGLAAAATVAVAFINGEYQTRRIEALKVIKGDQGIIDRDVMNVR